MTKQPFMPLFFGDFLASTFTWSGEEQAMYLLLLGYQWVTGPLPDDEKKLARAIRYSDRTFRQLWPTVRSKFEEVEGGIANARLEDHRRRSADIAAARAEIGRRGGLARAASARVANGSDVAVANGKQLPDVCQSKNQPSIPSHTGTNVPLSEGARKSRRPARRCPEDFEPDLDFASREVPGIDAEAEAAKFRDWEFAKARSDWAAAWRNWVRNARDRGSYARSPNGTGHPLPDTPEAPAILPNGQPNPIIVVGGRRVRQHIVGPEGQIGTNPEAVQW